MIINSYRIPAFTEIKMLSGNAVCRHSGDEARCTYVVVPLLSIIGLTERGRNGRVEEGNQGNGIGSLRLHIGHFGCMMLVGSYPWVSENKANKVSIESRLVFDQ